jgi:hypothetical protein
MTETMERDLDDGDRHREHERAEGLADTLRDDLRMVDRREHRREERDHGDGD